MLRWAHVVPLFALKGSSVREPAVCPEVVNTKRREANGLGSTFQLPVLVLVDKLRVKDLKRGGGGLHIQFRSKMAPKYFTVFEQ